MGFNDIPIDKYLAQDYRNTLRTSGSPQNIDSTSPILPVIDISKGFPQPNSKQTIKSFSFIKGAAADSQIATNSSTKRYYIIGWMGINPAAVNTLVYDATSGSQTVPVDGDTTSLLYATAAQQLQYNLINPRLVTNGIRISTSGNGCNCIVFYMEEIVQ